MGLWPTTGKPANLITALRFMILDGARRQSSREGDIGDERGIVNPDASQCPALGDQDIDVPTSYTSIEREKN